METGSEARGMEDRSAPGGSGESSPGHSLAHLDCNEVAGQSVFLRSSASPRRLFSADSDQEGPVVQGRGLHISSPSRAMEAEGLASEVAQLIGTGLSAKVVETLLHCRAPSTRKLYALK